MDTQMTNYDEEIKKHYDSVAKDQGTKPTSTMADTHIRETETKFILNTIAKFISGKSEEIKLVDVGCGNGFTLKNIENKFPNIQTYGIEQNDSLRKLAKENVKNSDNVCSGDIRRLQTLLKDVDILVCQRVIINLLDPNDQDTALKNLFATVKPGGLLIFIEAFQSGLDRLNEARKEFELDELGPAHHNLYLRDGFFDNQPLKPYGDTPPNILSTHFFITRVLHSSFTKTMNQDFKHNSHFVSFFSQALPEAIGNYAHLNLLAFTK